MSDLLTFAAICLAVVSIFYYGEYRYHKGFAAGMDKARDLYEREAL